MAGKKWTLVLAICTDDCSREQRGCWLSINIGINIGIYQHVGALHNGEDKTQFCCTPPLPLLLGLSTDSPVFTAGDLQPRLMFDSIFPPLLQTGRKSPCQ